MKDPRIATLIEALRRRFPGTTIITGPMPDAPDSGEVRIRLLNAPSDPPMLVHNEAWKIMEELWREDEPIPALVGAVSRENTAKYYAHLVPKAPQRPGRMPRRRKAPASGKPTGGEATSSARRSAPRRRPA